MSTPTTEFLRFTTHKYLAQRLVLSTLTGRPIHISQIRSSSPTQPGLAPHEISFLRLLDSISNGTIIQISYTGSSVSYTPGLITGKLGRSSGNDLVICRLSATCGRGISWFLQALCLLGPFSQAPLHIRFEGPGVITSATEAGDVSVDTVRTALLPLYTTNFGITASQLEIRVLQRSCAGPGGVGGAGVVEFRFACQVRVPPTLHLNRCPGRVRRVRGVAYCTGVSASSNARMIHAAREVLNPLLCDINIAAQYDQAGLVLLAEAGEHGEGKKRLGIGFGLSLVAETSSEDVIYSADVPARSEGGVTPEEVGKQCALQLLEVIAEGGCVSRVGVTTVLTLMMMGSEDIGRVRLGRAVLGTEEVITLARDFKKFGASSWGLRDVDDDDCNSGDVIVSVKGTGIGNVGKKMA